MGRHRANSKVITIHPWSERKGCEWINSHRSIQQGTKVNIKYKLALLSLEYLVNCCTYLSCVLESYVLLQSFRFEVLLLQRPNTHTTTHFRQVQVYSNAFKTRSSRIPHELALETMWLIAPWTLSPHHFFFSPPLGVDLVHVVVANWCWRQIHQSLLTIFSWLKL